ncbi:hypothetical protein BD626DRAFT_491422 [Schizophyllum amplum]|uniref:Uncharacterized protein n=1 Tax=Schizophyllum amplum TaxID=97359 RepID=A0A550CHN7_9AGAR|nr:hypothetical protein BD626DRAFT_491422 [Auriculariopsis ampla]
MTLFAALVLALFTLVFLALLTNIAGQPQPAAITTPSTRTDTHELDSHVAQLPWLRTALRILISAPSSIWARVHVLAMRATLSIDFVLHYLWLSLQSFARPLQLAIPDTVPTFQPLKHALQVLKPVDYLTPTCASHRELEQTRRDLLGSQKELSDLQERHHIIYHDLSASRHAYATTARDLAHARAALCELGRTQRDFEVAAALLGKKTLELEAAQGDLSTTKAHLFSTEHTLSATKHDLASAREELSIAQEDLHSTKIDLASASADIARRRAAYRDLREIYGDVLTSYNASRAQCARIQRKYTALDYRQQALERYTEEVKAMANGVLVANAALRKDNARLEEEMASAETEMARMKEENGRLRQEVASLHALKTTVANDGQESAQEVTALKEEVDELKATIDRLREAGRVVLEENDNLSEQLRVLKVQGTGKEATTTAVTSAPASALTALPVRGSVTTSMPPSTIRSKTSAPTTSLSTSTMASSSTMTLDLASLAKDRTLLLDANDSFAQAALRSSVASFASSSSSSVSAVLTEGRVEPVDVSDISESDMSICEFDCSPSSWTTNSSLPSTAFLATPPPTNRQERFQVVSSSSSVSDWSVCFAIPMQPSKSFDYTSVPSLLDLQAPCFRPQLLTSSSDLGSIYLREAHRPLAGLRRASSCEALVPMSLPLWPRLLEGELTAEGYRHALEQRAVKRVRLG